MDRTLNRNKSIIEYNEFGEQLCGCCKQHAVEHDGSELCAKCLNEIHDQDDLNWAWKKGE